MVSFGTAAFVCAGSHGVPFARTVPHGLVAGGFLIVVPGVRALLKQSMVLRDRRRRSLWRVET